jgi:hypothetical protein
MLLTTATVVFPATTALVASYLTPTRGSAYSANFVGIIAWGPADSEFLIYKNGVYQTGGRISAAEPTLRLDFGDASLGLIGGDIILVYASHAELTPVTVNVTLKLDLV